MLMMNFSCAQSAIEVPTSTVLQDFNIGVGKVHPAFPCGKLSELEAQCVR